MLVTLTDENRVFIGGFSRHFNLKELNMPEHETQKVISVGASHDRYYMTMEDGSVYTNKKIQNFDTTKYYGKAKMYKYACESGKPLGVKLSGKFKSVIGSADC